MSERLSGDFDDLLTRQRGVFARWQVLAMALDPGVVAASLRSGRFQRLILESFVRISSQTLHDHEVGMRLG
jgi:hypothetical protein